MRRGLALGCGGTVGGAWQVGALVALRDATGWEPHTADVVVGTSSGAHLAAMLGAGLSVDDLLAAQLDEPTAPAAARRFFTEPPAPRPRPPLGRPDPGLLLAGVRRRRRLLALSGLAPRGRTDASFLDDLIAGLLPDRTWFPHPDVRLVAVDAATGERVAFGSPGAPSAHASEALRASWAIPGWYPPVRIAGRDYVDGGVVATCSADLLAPLGLDEVVIVAPMASADGAAVPGPLGRLEGVMRTSMSRSVDTDVAALRAAGTRVLRIHPDRRELTAMGANFMDPRRRLAALEAALRHVPERLAAPATTTDGARS